MTDLEQARRAEGEARAREEDVMAKCVEMMEARDEQIRRARDLAATQIRAAEDDAARDARVARNECSDAKRQLREAETAAESALLRAEAAVNEERRRRLHAEEEAARLRREARSAKVDALSPIPTGQRDRRQHPQPRSQQPRATSAAPVEGFGGYDDAERVRRQLAELREHPAARVAA